MQDILKEKGWYKKYVDKIQKEEEENMKKKETIIKKLINEQTNENKGNELQLLTNV